MTLIEGSAACDEKIAATGCPCLEPIDRWWRVQQNFPNICRGGQYLQYLSQQYICGRSGSTVLQALRILAEPVAGRLQITHLQLPESESLIFCVIVMLNIVLALQASRLHTSYCRGRIVAVFVLSNGKFPLPSPFSSDFYLHCHPLPSSP